MERLVLLSVVLLGIVWSYGIAQQEPVAPLKLSISTPKDNYQLGDWIEVNLKIENTGKERIKIVKPIIDVYSISFKMEYVGGEKTDSPITHTDYTPLSFTHTAYTPSAYESKPDKAHLEKMTLDPGKDFSATFKIPAIRLGKLKITAVENGVSGGVEPSNTVTVDIILSEKDQDKQLVAVIDTNQGKIITKLYPNDAPNTVLNFVKLAKQGFYNNLIFHRVIKGFMIQGGCPKRDGTGGPGYSIKAEFNKQKHLEGSLAMARSQHEDSAGSQFYICLAPQSALDGKYTVFGQVIQGMEVVKKIGDVKTTGRGKPADKPLTDMVINKITIELWKEK